MDRKVRSPLRRGPIQKKTCVMPGLLTIYGSDIHLSWKDPQTEFIRLAALLKNRGKTGDVVSTPHPAKAPISGRPPKKIRGRL